MRAALVLALALGSYGVAAATGARTVRVDLNESDLGVTFCESDKPSAWVRADVLLTPNGLHVTMHELQHAKDMASFGSCREYKAWVARDPIKHLALMEASAFCTSVRADTMSGRFTWDEAISKYAAWLAREYTFGLTKQEAEALIRQFCHTAPAL